MIKCNAIHYKKQGHYLLSQSESVVPPVDIGICYGWKFILSIVWSCSRWRNVVWPRTSFFDCESVPNAAEWTFQKLPFFLLDQLNVNYPRYVWFRIHFIHHCYAIDPLLLQLHEYCIDLVFGKKSRILDVVDHIIIRKSSKFYWLEQSYRKNYYSRFPHNNNDS